MNLDPKKKFKVKGVVTEILAGTKFKVRVNIQGNDIDLMAHLSGKMRQNYIKIVLGDAVEVEFSLYDIKGDVKRGIIVFRH